MGSTLAGIADTLDVCDAPPGHARIVLIDDDWMMLSRLREIIAQSADLVVVAACRCADGTMLAIQHYRPALVILDVHLPDRDGVELISYIREISEAKVIVFTAALQATEVANILGNGAECIVFKDQLQSLVSCVRRVLVGESCFPPQITTREGRNAETSGDVRVLTPREREVAHWVVAGARNKEIACQLGISEGAVKLHLFRVYRKLKVDNRVKLGLALRPATADVL
jgi:DNA-binding NarL/FixJ family response regulator